MNLVGRRQDGTDRGASSVEYGLLVAAIAALIVIVVFALGGVLKTQFNDACDNIASRDKIAGNDDCTS